MNASFIRAQLQKLKYKQEPLQVERMGQDVAGALLQRDRLKLDTEEISFSHAKGALLTDKKTDAAGAILYLHGGGYCCGDLVYACGYGSVLAADTGAAVLCLAYRLAPECPFPQGLEDVLEAYQWLLNRYAPEKIAVAGESAGGGLVFALCLLCKERNLPLPGGLLALSPWTDITQTGPSYIFNQEADPSMTREHLNRFAEAYVPREEERTSPLCSPVYGDVRGFPPCRIYVGEDEIMLSDSRRMAEALQTAGCDCRLTVAPGMWHGYVLYDLKERRQDKAAIAAFLREVTA